MKLPLRPLFLLLTALLLAAGSLAAAPAPKKVLFFSKSSGFEHDAIKLRLADGRPGFAFPVLEALGARHAIEFTFSKDGSLFTPEYLAQFDAFFFYTSGDLMQAKSDPRGDGNPPMTAAGKAALLAAVAGGKGFVSTHSTSDTFHSHGLNGHAPGRWLDDGDAADEFVKMLGGEFIRHGAQQVSRVTVADPKFPGADAVPADFAPYEEWYSLKNFAADLRVVLVQETAGMKGPEYARAPYPSTWARRHGKGRVFYTSMGHREDIWTNPVFQALLAGALNWSLGRVEADLTPNLAQAAPQAGVLPVYVAPEPPAPAAVPTK